MYAGKCRGQLGHVLGDIQIDKLPSPPTIAPSPEHNLEPANGQPIHVSREPAHQPFDRVDRTDDRLDPATNPIRQWPVLIHRS